MPQTGPVHQSADSCSTVMQIYDPLLWVLQAFGLFIASTVQGAMWKGAQDHGGRGWFVALIWAVGSTLLLNAMHLLHDGLFPNT
jgi:fatty acid desaturase